jgi:hypothetical protein
MKLNTLTRTYILLKLRSSIPVLIGTIICWALLPDWSTGSAKLSFLFLFLEN